MSRPETKPGGSIALVMVQRVVKRDVQRQRTDCELTARCQELVSGDQRVVLGVDQANFARKQFLLRVQNIENRTLSGALLTRIDFGLALAAGQLDGVTIDLGPIAKGTRAPGELLDRASRQLGANALSERTRSYVLEQLRDLSFEKKPELVAERAVGLLLGAPELQRR